MSRYYASARLDIIPFLPQTLGRVLDVGCGSGATLDFLRERYAGLHTFGVELNAGQAELANKQGHKVWCGAVENCPWGEFIPANSLDAILCLDVLEHLVDPWEEVRKLSALLKPSGILIVSVPNIRNWKFIWRLLVKGDFKYRESGLLDRTHLRFFVRETAIELATAGGLKLRAATPAMAWKFPDARWFLSLLSGRKMDTLMAKQWIIISERPD